MFNANGTAAGSSFIVNSTTAYSQVDADVTAFADGRFVVAWTDPLDENRLDTVIRARIFNADGSAAGNDFVVNSTDAGRHMRPDISILADGRFVVSWSSDVPFVVDSGHVRARLFNVDGTPSGNDFLVKSSPTGVEGAPSVAAASDATFAITWTTGTTKAPFTSDIRAQIFDPKIFNGTDGADVWKGGNFNDTIKGLEGNDTLSGLAGNDYLSGGRGIDTLNGGLGDDTIQVDNASDVVVEAVGGGNDRVNSSSSYMLAATAEIETLAAANPDGKKAIELVGNKFDQLILGNAGNNVLNGHGGGDEMRGLGGNDLFYVTVASDIVVEAVGEGIFDRVNTRVSYVLQAGTEIESLRTTNANGGTSNLT